MTNANVKFDDARKRKLIEMLDADQLIQMLGIMREKGMTDLEELSDEYLSDATAKFDDEQDVVERKVMSETKDSLDLRLKARAPDAYDGNDSLKAEYYLVDIQSAIQERSWNGNDNKCLTLMGSYLTGDAKRWWQAMLRNK